MAEPLRIRFATDVAAAQSAMSGLASSIVSNMASAGLALKGANDNVGRLTSALSALPTAARAAIGAFAAFEALKFTLGAVEQAANAAKERLEDTLKIASGAQAAGVGTSFFQRFLAEAKDLGTESEKLAGILNRAREAATTRIGEGDQGASSAIGNRIRQNVLAGNLGSDASSRFGGAGSQEDRIRVVLALIEELRAKGAELAAFDLAGKMFGPDFENRLRAGTDMIGKMREALDGLKQVGADGSRILSPEEIAQAEKLRSTLAETQRIMADAMAPIQRDLAAYQAQQAQSAAEFYRNIAEAAAAVLRLYNVFASIGDKITELGNLPFWSRVYDAAKSLGLTSSAVQDLSDADRAALKGGLSVRVNKGPDTSRSLPSLTPKASGGAESKDEIERLITQLDRANETARAELETVGKTNVEREKALSLARLTAAERAAGRDATAEEREQVERLAIAQAQVKDRTMDAQQAIRAASDAMRTFGDLGANALSDMVTQGRSLNDVLKTVSDQLIRYALQAAITGSGPLAGIMGLAAPASGGANAVGGLLGGAKSLFGFAEGGLVHGPGTGTSDSILARLSRGEFVVRADAAAANIDLLQFINAPRFAAGGPVGPRMAASGGVTNNFTVVAPPGSTVRREERPNASGGIDVKAMIDFGVAESISTPGRAGNRALRTGFGAQPALTRR